jgi:hypothetical protein
MRQNTRALILAALAIAAIVLATGCGEDDWKKPASTPETTPTAGTAAGQPKAAGSDRTPAQAGAGEKGHEAGGLVAAPVTVPIATLFSVKERVPFEILIPDAIVAFQAKHGGPPASHEQFMKEVIEASHIRLPELPAGHHYLYAPEELRLIVVKDSKGADKTRHEGPH